MSLAQAPYNQTDWPVYHALQLKYQRRLSRGLQALASYSFSHSIDSASTDAFATRLNTPASLANANIDRGDSDFDTRHAATVGMTYDLPALASSGLARRIRRLVSRYFCAGAIGDAGRCGGRYCQFGRRFADAPPEPESGSAAGTVWLGISRRQGLQQGGVCRSAQRPARQFRSQRAARFQRNASRSRRAAELSR